MANLKETKASATTKTLNKNVVDQQTGNIYEAISVVAKRSIQINAEIKKELLEKKTTQINPSYTQVYGQDLDIQTILVK